MLYGAAYYKAMAATNNTTATKWTGDPESYTPEKYIEAAREVMGALAGVKRILWKSWGSINSNMPCNSPAICLAAGSESCSSRWKGPYGESWLEGQGKDRPSSDGY